jgi:outer membrane receptor for ferrienterochelin and colicins
LQAQAQDTISRISGIVKGKGVDGNTEVLAGAQLIWLNTMLGTITDSYGRFEIQKPDGTSLLVISYIGYQADTLAIYDSGFVEITLQQGIELRETEVVYRQKSTVVSRSATLHMETMGQEELTKAACCNLSESFETNPTVDVSFADAITGTKQIRMLGLAGPYSQLTRENMPDIRGLSAINGMEFIPGPWISSIQIIKGAGSVVNGYESIAGQINTELFRASDMPDFFLNMYLNNDRQLELNFHFKHMLGKKWQNSVFVHGRYSRFLRDMNKDGFADKPANERIIFMDRAEWINDKNIHLEIGARYIYHDVVGGQTGFSPNQERDTLSPWGLTSQVRKADAWIKIGKVNPLRPWQSTAFQFSGSIYRQNAIYGTRSYAGQENSLYGNLIHVGQLGSEKHEFKVGASLLVDDFDERFENNSYQRYEFVPGIFGEYSFKPIPTLTMVGGMRLDNHNQYGSFGTPRFHARWEFVPRAVLRLSAGRGFRTPNVFSEHMSMLATQREIIISSDRSGYGYGLQPEIAWNYGLSMTYSFELDYREAVVQTSFFRTDFINQLVFDLDQSFSEVHMYNLNGESFANSFQLQIDYELIKRLDMRIAYRFYDVKTTFTNQLMQVPLIARHRGFINLAYKTRNYWKFDATLNWVGPKRIPIHLPVAEHKEYSPDYLLINAQISKSFQKKLDVYIGVENIGNFRQRNPIISVNEPYADGFDASLVWGPIWGQHLYVGFRWNFKK